MKQEFIPYEQALEIKELGFDEPCLAFYDGKNAESFYFNNMRDASGDYIPFQKHDRLKWFGAPLYQQAFRWFREKYDLQTSNIMFSNGKYDTGITRYKGTQSVWGDGPIYDTYEEAELECLKKLIEIVKEETK